VTRKRWWIVIGVVAVVAAAAVGLSLAFVGGGGSGKSGDTTPVGAGWERIYHESHVGAKQADVLALWPKIPYQHYSDNLKDDCYEWQGDNLYDLCFKNGVLRLKTTF
jgi:hypothetical protein